MARVKDSEAISRPGTRKSIALTILMGFFILYTVVPLLWLFINATKSQEDLFSSFGLWFGDDFALFSNIKETLTYRDGVYLRWLANTMLYVVVGAGGATLLATMPATAWPSSDSLAGVGFSPSCWVRSRCRARPWRCPPS